MYSSSQSTYQTRYTTGMKTKLGHNSSIFSTTPNNNNSYSTVLDDLYTLFQSKEYHYDLLLHLTLMLTSQTSSLILPRILQVLQMPGPFFHFPLYIFLYEETPSAHYWTTILVMGTVQTFAHWYLFVDFGWSSSYPNFLIHSTYTPTLPILLGHTYA